MDCCFHDKKVQPITLQLYHIEQDIRNMKPLTNESFEYLKDKCSREELLYVISLYAYCNDTQTTIIKQLSGLGGAKN